MSARLTVTRVQTGVRLEKRVLQVLKGLAASLDLALGDLLEGIVLHAFEGKAPFGRETLAKVAALKKVYGLDLRAADSHRLDEAPARDVEKPRATRARPIAKKEKPAKRRRRA